MSVEAQRRRKTQHLRHIMENLGQLEQLHNGLKALAPHFAGGYDEQLVFGGHLLAQFYLVAKQLRDDAAIHRIDVNFLAMAATDLPINYEKTQQRGDLLWLDARQENKLIDKSVVKYKAPLSQTTRRNLPENPPLAEFTDLPSPTSCPVLETAPKSEKSSEPFTYEFSHQDRQIFEVRPIEQNGKRIRNYMRLRKELRDSPINDPMVVPLMISDYLACLPLSVLNEKLRVQIESMTSLNHKVVIHTEKCNPNGWFILELNLEAATTDGLVLGRVAAEDGTPILNFSQNFQFQLNNQPKL
ncbi:unnamed protein product [Bursaphelenchus okinawaensis]|uniref:Uncharacterized protein n=1 Tax=Bursaphelenchus okinawaensis TaxID=465554 RepID=A0A811JQU3_9BILA|nr:unnamed protein product [Bursaphelenchus okinawaensis]CAG9078099.1 unnamed protein product [Bursaphelenchus okinawaensis]